MKKVLVELEMPDLELKRFDKNDCEHIILQKIISLQDEEHWQCVFCKTIIKEKKDEVQEKFQK